MRVKFLEYVIQHFEERLQGKYCVSLEEIGKYEDLLELIFTCIFPPIADDPVVL